MLIGSLINIAVASKLLNTIYHSCKAEELPSCAYIIRGHVLLLILLHSLLFELASWQVACNRLPDLIRYNTLVCVIIYCLQFLPGQLHSMRK